MHRRSSLERTPGFNTCLRSLVLLLVAWSGACSGEDSPPDTPPVDGGMSSPDGGLPSFCRRDESRIQANEDCISDEDCPCGAHCALGSCRAECLSDSDCAAGFCGPFGRCREEAEVVPGLAPQEAPTFDVRPKALETLEPNVPRSVFLTSGPVALGPIRIVADEGLEVSCDGGTAFALECTLSELAADAEVPILLRAPTALDDAVRRIRFFSGAHTEIVSYREVDFGSGVARSGRYAGRAVVRSVGIRGEESDLARVFGIPGAAVEANVFLEPGDSEGRLVLFEPTNLIAPVSPWIGRLSVNGSDVTVAFPAVRTATEAVAADMSARALAVAAPAAVRLGAGFLSFSLRVELEGATPQATRPVIEVAVTLARTGDLPAGELPPDVPADETHAVDPDVLATTPSPWEAAFAATRETITFLRDDLQTAALATYDATAPRLDACGLDTDEHALVAQRAAFETLVGQGGAISHLLSGSDEDPTFRENRTGQTHATLAAGDNFVMASVGSGMFNAYDVASSFYMDLFYSGAYFRGPPELDGTIFCGMEHDAFSFFAEVPSSFGESVNVAANTMDECANVAARYGCTVETLSSPIHPRVYFTMHGRRSSDGGLFQVNPVYLGGSLMTFSLTKVCRLPRTSPSCAGAFSCFDSSIGGNTAASVQTPPLTGDVRPASGDLVCNGGTRSMSLPIYEQAELAVDDPDRLTAAEIYDLCLTDLDGLRNASAPANPGPFADGLAQILVEGRCIDAARTLIALGQLDTSSTTPASQAVRHRLLQQWVTLHAYLARDALERERFAAIIRREPFSGGGTPSAPETLLDASLDGWALLTHPRIGAGLTTLSGAVLAGPDYRPFLAEGPFLDELHHAQGVGLPIALVEALEAQADLSRTVVERLAIQRASPDARLTLTRFYRALATVWPVARSLYARARTYVDRTMVPEPAWLETYLSAEASMLATVQRLYEAEARLAAGANPLGIDERELPLYFFGDEVGPGGRFLAVSDYLLGSSPASSAWAPSLLNQASDALSAARSAWLEREERKLFTDLAANERDRREEEVRLRYGTYITNLCGPIPGVPTREILETNIPINPDQCFIRTEQPQCVIQPAQFLDALTAPTIAKQVCVVGELKTRVGASAAFLNADLDALAVDFASCTDPEWLPGGCPEQNGAPCFRCAGGTAAIDADAFRNVRLEGVGAGTIDLAKSACDRRWPEAQPLPTTTELSGGALDDGACYQGSLGELALTVRSVASQVQIARSSLAELSEAYDIAMRSCILRQIGNDRREGVLAQHNTTMTEMRDAKFEADRAATSAEFVKDCASAVGGDQFYGGTAGVSCAAGLEEANARIKSDNIQRQMDEAQQAHEALMLSIENEIEEQVCFNDAEMELVGARTASLEVAQAVLELQVVLARLANDKSAVPTFLAEGRSVLRNVQDRTLAQPMHDYWLDERLETFARKMRLARRAAYLATRAVEYELQASLSARQDVLSAATPSDLDAALDDVRLAAASRRINGRAPTDLKVVLSLKDQILQIADRSGWPEGDLPLSDVERFRLLLVSPRYAEYDADGTYLGQRIPFSIAPLGTLGLGNAQGVSVLTGGDCAERLWALNATVHGPEGVVQGGSTAVRLDIQKSNDFFSQWCTPPAEGEPAFQNASYRPSRNLFREPGLGTEVGDPLGTGNSDVQFSTARIEARTNVPRTELDSDAYTDGASAELAARGLYGDYALFVPAGSLSLPQSGGSRTDGLALHLVEDILLRLDYVSVAR